jgi:glycosyltransferase involved in cell wall biosynthesis
MPKVSVIIPAYNGERYIKQAIDSVLRQTYLDREIIVVDDGSTDNTREILESYGGRLNWIAQENQGVAASRNTGLKLARGEYIAFLDQDDIFLPDKLTFQIPLLEEEPSLGLVSSGWQIVNDTGNIVAAVQPWQKLTHLDLVGLIVWKPVFLGAMVFRRCWLDRVGGFDILLEQTPDVDLVLRLATIGCRADWVKQATVNYRQHEANASKDTILQARELNEVVEKFFQKSGLPLEVKRLEASSRYQSLVWSAWRLYHTGHLAKAIDYLDLSFTYSNKYPTETVLNWIESFKNYAAEYGSKIDVYALSNSSDWQKLIGRRVL